MMIIRPIHEKDHDDLWHIAQQTGAGFTSLPPNKNVIEDKLAWALKSFEQFTQGRHSSNTNALYLFVIEDSDSGNIVGCAAIESAVGLNSPWYNYHVSKQVHISEQLQVYHKVDTLMLCNDHTGCSELCTLFLLPEYRHSKNGALLSKSRMLFLACYPELFAERIFAEMRGYSDENGVSPFWEGLGRLFFEIDFAHADQRSALDKSFIAELMPRHPIYTNLLAPSARDAIAITHESTTPARRLLESEGFHYTHYIGIFDAGPLLEARVNDLRIVEDTRQYNVNIVDHETTDNHLWLIANGSKQNFRCIMGTLAFEGLEVVNITQQQATALNVQQNDTIHVVSLSRH